MVILFLIVSLDIIFESIFGFNTLGFNNNLPGRISSFLNDELKIGNYYFGFILLARKFIFYNYKKNYLFYSVSYCLFNSVILTGERSNFIKIFMGLQHFSLKKTIIFKKFFIILILFFSHF